jgi:hypothetical protein
MTADGIPVSNSEAAIPGDNLSDFTRVDEADGSILPSPFEDSGEDNIGLRPMPEFRDVRRFYFVLDEDALPFYERGTRITSQFGPTSFRRTKTSKSASSGGYSMPHEINQWIGGGQETISMEVRLFSMHSQDQTARDKYTILKDLAEPNPDLGRPPILLFFWGNIIPDGFPCYIDGWGDEQFDEIRPDGSIRGVTLQLTLRRYTDFFIEQEAAEPQERTPTQVAKDGDTYELIAGRHYGDPMYGVLLRRMNSRKPFEDTAPRLIADLEYGDKVKIYPKRDMQSAGRITPESHILKGTSNALHARTLTFQERAKKVGFMPRK